MFWIILNCILSFIECGSIDIWFSFIQRLWWHIWLAYKHGSTRVILGETCNWAYMNCPRMTVVTPDLSVSNSIFHNSFFCAACPLYTLIAWWQASVFMHFTTIFLIKKPPTYLVNGYCISFAKVPIFTYFCLPWKWKWTYFRDKHISCTLQKNITSIYMFDF